MNRMDAYAALLSLWREAHLIASSAATLEWEQQTTLPTRASEYRAQQIAYLAGLHHEKSTDPRVGDLLHQLESSPVEGDPLSVEAVNVREIRRAYDRQTKLPKSLVEALAQTCSLAQHEWARARQERDFAHFQPWLSKVIELTKSKAIALDPQAPAYDTLLDEYERGATSSQVEEVFTALREPLVRLVQQIGQAKRSAPTEILHRSYPNDRQQIFGEMAAAEIGFDFDRGRLDTTTHPFCTTLGPHDCRILTRYNAHYFNESFFGILHEAGHGLYEQGLQPEHFGTPMGEAVSLGIHESQSRFWENQVGRSRPFWNRFFPRARGVFREALRSVSVDDFHFAVNGVAPSFIRVEADEATYNLHVMIRFELEQAIVSGDLPIADIPRVWNERYRDYLGITPSNDAEGCLQDVHWSAGLIGYFPTYTLGNVYSAQISQAADRDLGGIDGLIERGEFRSLLDWLRDRIHRHGKRYSPRELVRQATGQDLSPAPLLQSLREKLSSLYGL
jgi:carboxypeptidase Taq